MKSRDLGQTGLRVSELGLGTWGLSGDAYGPVSPSEARRVIERARSLGITLFETADSYANGKMEQCLGEVLAGDDQSIVVTKLGTDLEGVPARKRFDREYLAQALERSSTRLKRPVMDVVLLHNPSECAFETTQATDYLGSLVGNGQLRAWGVSAGSVGVGEIAVRRGAQLLSLTHNVFHQMDLRALSKVIEKSSLGVLAHSVLAFGLLAGLWPGDKDFTPGDHRFERWTRDELRLRVRQLGAVRPVVGGGVPSLRAAALRFVLSEPLVSSALLGPRSALQLDQLVREAGTAGGEYLTPDKKRALMARLADVGIEV